MATNDNPSRKRRKPKTALGLLQQELGGHDKALLEAIPMGKIEIIKHKDPNFETYVDTKIRLGSIMHTLGTRLELWAYMTKDARDGTLPEVHFSGFHPTKRTYHPQPSHLVLDKADFQEVFQVLRDKNGELSTLLKVLFILKVSACAHSV
jgi:hypothetical protein